jgi:hypothetical protein
MGFKRVGSKRFTVTFETDVYSGQDARSLFRYWEDVVRANARSARDIQVVQQTIPDPVVITATVTYPGNLGVSPRGAAATIGEALEDAGLLSEAVIDVTYEPRT